MKSLLMTLILLLGTGHAQANPFLTFQDQVNIINALLESEEAQSYPLSESVSFAEYMAIYLRDHLSGMSEAYGSTVKLICLTSTPEMYTCLLTARRDDGEVESLLEIMGEVYLNDQTKQIQKIENIRIRAAG